MPVTQFVSRSIGRRLIILTVAMVVVLFGGLGIFIAGQNAKALGASLASKSASVADLACRTGAEQLANFNFIALDQLVDDILKDPDVSFAGIYNDKKELVTKRQIPQRTGNLHVVDRQLKDNGDVVIGTLKIGYKQESVHKSLYRSIVVLAVGILAAIILFSIGIAVASRKLILAPINRLCEFTAHVSAGDLSRNLDVTSNDELGLLAGSINSMVANLNRMVQQVNSAAKELHLITENLSGASDQVVNAARLQAEGVTATSSAVSEINSSVNEVSHGVGTLSVSATESSSSILQIAASVEEVAVNMESLGQSVEEVSSSIIEMASSAKQIGTSVSSLQEATTTTASSLVEMDNSIKQVEKNAVETAAISEEVRKGAETGKEAVEATILGINEIKTSSRITSDVIDTLSAKAEDIGAILSVIDDVAKQTNLLALNAAIIAAQAGEHGKGFSVVAEEIKGLAERTTSSTREIAYVINGVQDETRRAVQAIRQAEERIAEGEKLSRKSGEALATILSGAERATVQVESIARSAMEQARGSRMIRDAMERVSEMVSHIAAATREQGRGSEQIMAAVEQMKGLTGHVQGSTSEQSKVGKFIAQSTETITDMIQQIKRACEEQTRGSARIVVAVEEIESSTSTNLDATKVMNEAVSQLADQTDLLKKEIAVFKV